MEYRKRKIVVVGMREVGKTAVCRRICHDTFPADYEPTIGVDFAFCHIKEAGLEFHIWDSAGQERFESLVPSYLKEAHLVCFVYNVGQLLSFVNIEKYLGMAKAEPNTLKPVFLLIANQTDRSNRTIQQEQGEKYAEDNDMLYLEFSAQQDSGKVIVSKILEALEKWEITAALS